MQPVCTRFLVWKHNAKTPHYHSRVNKIAIAVMPLLAFLAACQPAAAPLP
jgi:hypothetical protein